MAVFDLSGFNKGTAKTTQDYSVLVDQLSIYENQLAADGKLSPGDYKLLIQKGQELASHAGLTPANRAAIQVKISGWQSASQSSQLKQQQDITAITNNTKDDVAAASMYLGNNPAAFLKAQAASQQAKIGALADAINQMDASGQDTSAHLAEYNSALQDYSDTLEALDTVSNYKQGQPPTSDQVAYVTTNGKGEITDVKIGRTGSQGGYVETNGLYGGLKIYGKVNRTENGQNVFLLGNKTFSGTNLVTPSADGSLKPATLVDTSMQKGKPGVFTTAAAGYSYMDSNTMRTQGVIPNGAYGKGANGFLYQRNADGSYTKYVNADPKKMNIADNDIISLPSAVEQSIIPQVKSTNDMSVAQPTMPQPTSFAPSTPTTTPSVSSTTPTAAGGALGRPSTGAPTVRAASSPLGVASNLVKSAGSFLGNLFGGGK